MVEATQIVRRAKMQGTGYVKSALFHCGFFDMMRRSFPTRQVTILRYHAIVDPPENYYASAGISVSRRDFARHVQYFARHYNVVSMDEVIWSLRHQKTLPPNSVAFTFDDGYADNYHAHEILKELGATGTFYVTAGCLGGAEPFWLFEIFYLIKRATRDHLLLRLGGREQMFDLTKQSLRRKAISELVRLGKTNTRKIRDEMRSQLRAQLADRDYEDRVRRVMLSWDEVHDMFQDGMGIGGHTMTHLNLPNALPAEARNELTQCRSLLQQRLGMQEVHFAYPNSGPYRYFDDRVKAMVRDCGFASSTTSAWGFVDASSDLFALHRVRTVPSLPQVVASIELSKLANKIRPRS